MVRISNKKWRRPPRANLARYRSQKFFSGSKIQEEKKRPKWLYKIIIYIILITIIAFFLFFSDYFRVKEVIIEGNNLVLKERIEALIPINSNIFRLSIVRIKNDLTRNIPEVQTAQIYRGIPNAIKIVVIERQGKFVWQSGTDSYLISDQGEVMRKIIGDEGKDLPRVIDKRNLPVTLGSQLVSPNFVAFILNVYSNFFQTVNIKPLDFEVDETTFDVILHTDASFYVKLNSLRSSKKQLDNLKLVLVNKRADIHEYVDIRIDGWAYYK